LNPRGYFQVLVASASRLGLRQVEVSVLISRLALSIIIVGLIIIRPGG
jgi:hypothetical protein